jgi:hypothetical protein
MTVQFTEKGVLEKNLRDMEEVLLDKKDKDMVVLVIGQPGTSKSSLTLMMQLALRNGIDFENMAFTHDQYMDAAKNGEKHKVIQYDEGRDSFYKRRAMSSSNTEALDMLNQYRYKGHIHFINFQNLTDLELDLVYKRCHALIKTPRQGVFHFYNQRTVRQIHVDKQTRKVDWPEPNFVGNFPDPSEEYPEKWKQYQQVLEDKLNDKPEDEDEEDWEEKYRRLRRKVAKTFVKHLDMTQADAAETVGVDRSMYSKWKKNHNLGNLPPYDLSEHVE